MKYKTKQKTSVYYHNQDKFSLKNLCQMNIMIAYKSKIIEY